MIPTPTRWRYDPQYQQLARYALSPYALSAQARTAEIDRLAEILQQVAQAFCQNLGVVRR